MSATARARKRRPTRCRDLMHEENFSKKFSDHGSFALDVTLNVLASISILRVEASAISMGIKSDKTFEEIVERLVALFKPEPQKRDSDAVPSHQSTSNSPDRDPSIPSASTPTEDQTQ